MKQLLQRYGKMPLSKTRLKDLISFIKYKDWDIVLRYDEKRPYLQIQFDGKDSFTGEDARQYCRKWMLSEHMCESEVVRTAYKAVLAAEEHEAGELFRFCGQPVYRPHVDVWELHTLSSLNRVDKRGEL